MRRSSKLITAVCAVLTLLALLGFRSFIMTTFVQPVALLFWAAWRALASVNQQVYWIALIIVCAGFALQLLPAEVHGATASTFKYHYRQPTRLKAWEELIARAATGKDETESLQAAIRKLLLTVLASTEHAGQTDSGQLAGSAGLDLPPAARRLLLQDTENAEQPKTRRALGTLASPLLRLHRRLSARPSNQEILLSEALNWMESRMEMHDDQ